MNTRILIAVVLSMFIMCPHVIAQAEDVPKTEVTELEGTWEAVSEEVNGEKIADFGGYLLRFESNRMYWQPSGDVRSEGAFSVDSSAMPAEIDIDYPPHFALGIYNIDDNVLTICIGFPETFEPGSRPARFESTETYCTLLTEYRRVEEESE